MIPLLVRSHFSLGWGTSSPDRLCARARELGYDRLALTDTNNLYGLWDFLSACRRHGIVPIVGAEVTDPETGRRAVCLVENQEGFSNLCRILTRRHCQRGFSLERAVKVFPEGLTVLTDSARLLSAWCREGVRTAGLLTCAPSSRNRLLAEAAQRLGVHLVAAPDSFFATPEEAPVHRLLRAISQNTCLSRLEPGDCALPDAWLAGSDEYTRRFAACPEAIQASHEIAERLAFTGPAPALVMPPWKEASGRDAAAILRQDAYAGAQKRYGRDLPENVVERLEHELAVIRDMNFSSYFLVVADIVRKSPRVCGRGSGAASLVAYCLGITNVCPVKHNLYFERFLNPGRTDPPDLDIDFAWDERDGVIARVLGEHPGRAAMVCSIVLFQPRMAVRETAKIFGLPEAEISRVTKKLPWHWRESAADEGFLDSVCQRPETQGLSFPEPWPEIMALARRLLGMPRHLSVHPGGVVLTPDAIDGYAPLEMAKKGVPVIQWDKDGAEEAGLVKIDLLGNRSLGVIRDAVDSLTENGAHLPDRWEPEDDPATQAAVAMGRTMGCFYIESPAMRLLQKKARVGDFEHLVIHSSIIRPAANDYIREYVHRLHGGEWDPIHPLLSDVLSETYGIMVYQEDVSRAAVALAGFSHAEADRLRKVMSKKDREHHLTDYRERFFSGAAENGVVPETAAQVWDMILSFSGYSFCKPHSASYARVSFQAAYLKEHFPAEFMAAVISNQGGFYSCFAYVSEARRMGLALLPPDVNQSRIAWHGRDRKLRVGLMAIRSLSEACRCRIVGQRLKGSFSCLEDFLARVRPNEDESRALILAGALDRFEDESGRAGLLWRDARWRKIREKPGQMELFRETVHGVKAPAMPPEAPLDRLRREFSVLGFLCEHHPMELFRGSLAKVWTVPAADLARHAGKRVRTAGWLITGKVVRTKHNDPMEFLTFEDETGTLEATFFPEAYARFARILDHGRPYLLEGKVEEDWGTVTLTVDSAQPLAATTDA
ncbi:MAG: DNA polymerase III subunit alpha [Proteobacteria bacterium]|nr:DNA polymerase III subunit alpha [Pseudomonadota bacterium]